MIEAWIITAVLVLVRVATFWMFVPIWNLLKPPRMVKMGLIISLTLFWLLQLTSPVEPAIQWATGSYHWVFLVLLIAREILVGVMLAIGFNMFLVPLQIAGAYIGQELGLSMATQTDPNNGAINNVFATLFQTIGIAAFFILDLHHFLIYSLHSSFTFLPAGQAPRPETFEVMLHGFAEMTTHGLELCAPIAIVSFLLLVALLLLARTAPALNLFSVGIPVRLFLGLVALLVLLPTLIANFGNQFEIGKRFIEEIVGSL